MSRCQRSRRASPRASAGGGVSLLDVPRPAPVSVFSACLDRCQRQRLRRATHARANQSACQQPGLVPAVSACQDPCQCQPCQPCQHSRPCQRASVPGPAPVPAGVSHLDVPALAPVPVCQHTCRCQRVSHLGVPALVPVPACQRSCQCQPCQRARACAGTSRASDASPRARASVPALSDAPGPAPVRSSPRTWTGASVSDFAAPAMPREPLRVPATWVRASLVSVPGPACQRVSARAETCAKTPCVSVPVARASAQRSRPARTQPVPAISAANGSAVSPSPRVI